jgi:hypothetical protein
MVKFANIVTVRLGCSFRGRLVEDEGGTLPVVQFKDLTGSVFSNADQCVRICADKIKIAHWLKDGEILVSNRGICKVAVNRCRYPCVASGVFFVLTVQDKNFLPEYIAVFLNSQEGQKTLMMHQNISGMLSINRGELEKVDIPLISIEKQQQIIELYALYEKEVDLFENIKKVRKKLINSVLSQIVKE